MRTIEVVISRTSTSLATVSVLLMLICSTTHATAAPMPAPVDKPLPGEIHLDVDATDIARRVVHIRERVTGLSGHAVLYYPKWIPGTHSPTGPITRLAGLQVSANGAPMTWARDPLDVYAFHVTVPHAAKSLELQFDYDSPVTARAGSREISDNIVLLDWNQLLLYPAGYFVRQIPVTAEVRLPRDWQYATALAVAAAPNVAATASVAAAQDAAATQDKLQFQRVSLEQLVDSPLMAGRHHAQFDLDPGGRMPVRLHLFAEDTDKLAVKPEQLEAFRELMRQGDRLFGARHFAHYDHLLALSDQLGFGIGLEHQQSQVQQLDPDWFVKWEEQGSRKDDPAHELAHSWNGKYRRPADIWIPNFNVPMQDELLWLYEGQTQYWGYVLTARAGLWTRQQMLERLAMEASGLDMQAGRAWRPLQDTTNDPVASMRQPRSWNDWERSEDYYVEGAFLWLEADALIRRLSGDTRSLDDFARRFFGGRDGEMNTVTYTFADIVSTLNSVQPHDWAKFLRDRLDQLAPPTVGDALRAAGYELSYNDTPGDFQDKASAQFKRDRFTESLGLNIAREEHTINSVRWDSPAFKAGILPGSTVVAVNGDAYKGELLQKAIVAARASSAPIELLIKNNDRYRTVKLDYHDGLRSPHLRPIEKVRSRLDDIMARKP
jgi:predicted metalloprotease with PDZ domain